MLYISIYGVLFFKLNFSDLYMYLNLFRQVVASSMLLSKGYDMILSICYVPECNKYENGKSIFHRKRKRNSMFGVT